MGEELSEHDKAILNCVFNPNLPIQPLEDPPVLEDIENNSEELEETKKLEIAAIKSAESGNLDEALKILNKAIEITPERASLYNNRAYVLQFQKKFTQAFDDLSKAILLADPEKQKRTLAQAHCQRGVLHRRASRVELARADFEISARLGNQFAKSQMVELNPYAALCNQMLKNVMELYNPPPAGNA